MVVNERELRVENIYIRSLALFLRSQGRIILKHYQRLSLVPSSAENPYSRPPKISTMPNLSELQDTGGLGSLPSLLLPRAVCQMSPAVAATPSKTPPLRAAQDR